MEKESERINFLKKWTKQFHGEILGTHLPEVLQKEDNRGRKRADLETLLRIYFLQQWFSLSDLSAEEMVHDRLSFRRFIHIDICETSLDETTIGKFRNFLEENHLTEKCSESSGEYWKKKDFS